MKKRTLEDLQEDEGFRITGQASGYTTPQIGAFASDYGYQPFGMMGPARGMFDPYQLGMSIGQVASGYDATGAGNEPSMNAPGPFSQIGGAMKGIGQKVGGEVSGAVGAVGDFIGWGEMKPMEKAQILSHVIGTGADLYGSYKQGKIEDEERKKRQRSAEAMRPFIQSLMERSR